MRKNTEDALRQARASRDDLLKRILQQPSVPEAFDELATMCDRAWLQAYMTEPVQSAEASEDADSRKHELNLIRQLRGSLKKTQRVLEGFREMSGEPLGYLDDAVGVAIEQIRPWAERLRPVALFTPRQNQQFRLLNRIWQRTHRRQFGKTATLLGAIYTARGVPEEEHPTEKSLEYLAKRFEKNQQDWRKARLTSESQK